MGIANVATAIAYLQGALHYLGKAEEEDGRTRELSITVTNVETGLLWLEKHREFAEDVNARPAYLHKRQPYCPPEFYDVEVLKSLTEQERIGMFGYDPLKEGDAQ